ncbi:MAG: hypothetical protein ABIW79_09600 [Gemmatimonas sp.]
MSDIDLRARSTSEIVDAAFSLYRRHFLQYTVVTAIAYSPVLLVSLLLPGFRNPQTPSDLVGILPVYLVSIITVGLVSGVIMHMGSDAYLGREPDVGRTISAVAPRIPSLLAATFLTTFLLMIGLLLLIFPVFYVIARFFPVPQAVVLENKGPLSALDRAGELTKGRKGHVLMTLLLVFGIYVILSVGISLVATMMGNVTLSLLISTLFSILAYPIVNLVSMVLYYDLRIRGEGFDVEHMSSALGTQSPYPA